MKPALTVILVTFYAALASAQTDPTWRYYRPGNTGIQGDYNEAVWVAPDGDPYISGYNASFEEGGFAKFIQSENRWVNYSNVDYPVIGHPDLTGTTRVSDFVPEAGGRLWAATWRGAIRFDPAQGTGSLARFGPGNSQLTDDRVTDIDRAPDSSIWFANQGIVRYNPAADAWTRWSFGNKIVSAQPKPNGGYLIWSGNTPPAQDAVSIFDSDSLQWRVFTPSGAPNEVVGFPGKDCVDDSGNLWAIRSGLPGNWNSLDYRHPDGVWITPPEPNQSFAFYVCAFKAYGDGNALAADESGMVYQFNGSTWSELGMWNPGAYTYSIDIDTAGDVWVSGIGGAAKRNAQTGQWQRYRVTNTSQIDYFVNDLALDNQGNAWMTGNATTGIGGFQRYDDQRWYEFNSETYGLGQPFPFLSDNTQAIAFRLSSGAVVFNPTYNGLGEWTGSRYDTLETGTSSKALAEDSQGRLWSLGDYYSLRYHNGSSWANVPIVGSGAKLKPDSSRPGTVWAATDYELVRTDGTYRFSRMIEDFPGSAAWFTGMAVDTGGIAWIGTWSQFTSTGSTLIRIDANTGAYQTWRHDSGWPFPGEHVRPLTITPDGRLWMQYDSEYPSTDAGLCWYDGTNVGTFPAPPGGVPQWGGLPNSTISDLEVRVIPGGYELWMSCMGRGVAVLTVPTASTCNYIVGDVNNNGAFNGIDVIYSVNYFKGGPIPPYSCECTPGNTWYVAGDVNGNCNFNGIDVSYMVGFLKGGPVLIPCPACPPARLSGARPSGVTPINNQRRN